METCKSCGQTLSDSVSFKPLLWLAYLDKSGTLHIDPYWSMDQLDNLDEMGVVRHTGVFPAETPEEADEKARTILEPFLK